jgi:hypothetical protein
MTILSRKEAGVSCAEGALEFGHFADPFGLPLSETLSSFMLTAATRMLTHHKLNVYEKARTLGAEASDRVYLARQSFRQSFRQRGQTSEGVAVGS